MSDDAAQAERIKQLVELACIARGWSRQALAAHLGRDVSRLVPEAGNPKLDYVMKLADALEWPVGDVARVIWGARRAESSASHSCKDYDEAMRAAHDRLKSGDVRGALSASRSAGTFADKANDQAHAIGNEAACLNLLGRHIEAAEVANLGLALEGLTGFRRLHLQSNLVLALVKLRRIDLALGLAGMVHERAALLADSEPRALREGAFAQYASGYCHLQLAFIEPDLASSHLDRSTRAYRSARCAFEVAADKIGQVELLGMTIACDAGILEVEVESGRLSPDRAIEEVMKVLDRTVDVSAIDAHTLEACGWWAIAGASIALRHLAGASLQRTVAVCTEKAIEIAERLDQWFIRERAFTMQYLGQRRLSELTGLTFEYVIDDEDRANITALMGRFPAFRGLGVKILSGTQDSRGSRSTR